MIEAPQKMDVFNVDFIEDSELGFVPELRIPRNRNPIVRSFNAMGKWMRMQFSGGIRPRVLVCMPFQQRACEAIYCNVVRPMITGYFGGEVTRLSHPISGDWQAELRKQLVLNHLIVFDHSFFNENVDREWRYWASLYLKNFEPTYRERADICIRYLGDGTEEARNDIRPLIEKDSRLLVEYDRIGSMLDGRLLCYIFGDSDNNFVAYFRDLMCEALCSLGARRVWQYSWTLRDRFPPVELIRTGRAVRSHEEAKKALEDWKNKGI